MIGEIARVGMSWAPHDGHVGAVYETGWLQSGHFPSCCWLVSSVSGMFSLFPVKILRLSRFVLIMILVGCYSNSDRHELEG